MLRISRRRPERSLLRLPGLSLCQKCFLQLAITALLFVVQVSGNNPPKVLKATLQPGYLEDTPVGTILGTLEATDVDGDSLNFTTVGEVTNSLVSLSEPRDVPGSPNAKVVDIVLKTELDRDFEAIERKLEFEITDALGMSASYETIIFIRDVIDVAPTFVNLPYTVTIKENARPGNVIFSGVSVFDPDVGRSPFFSMEPNAQAADADYRGTFKMNQYNGNITLEKELDYEKHSYFQFIVMAEDEAGNKADPVSFVVYVLDVQDSPPIFINLPYSVQIDEDTPVGQPIQKIVALDGDRGIPNNITYRFNSGDYTNFDIDSLTGEITIRQSLDRDSEVMRNKGGVYAMTVEAAEDVAPGQVNTGETTATTLVTITVRDVNDNRPLFGQQNYRATILENMQEGVPVGFQGPIMQVSDIDQGTNSHFYLTLQQDGKPYYDFSPQPQDIYSESSVVIRVNNSDVLDYEKNKRVVFEVIARELDTEEKLSSTATMTVDIEDMNDNAPVFTQAQLTLDIPEDTAVNTPVATYIAEDEDSGDFGAIQYSIRGGNGRFRMEPTSGVLSVVGALDREENTNYYLTVEARDGGGLRTPVEVTVNIQDVNDNKPVFRRDDYEGIVREEEENFARPVIVEAVDEDEENTPNSLVSYRLVQAPPGLESNFTVNAATGEVSLTRPLDYEQLDPALAGRVTLVVEAFDAGTPQKSSQVMVNITVEDDNDFSPVFTSSEYTTTIPENSLEGYVVKTVSAVDNDGTSPNNDFIYRIESGAVDKFRIDFETGDVQVEKGADLDRETRSEYTLTLSAIDRGTPPRTGYSSLKIILSDVNDESPKFTPDTRTVTVNENTQVNSPVLLFSAVDRDLNPNLAYSISKITAINSDKPEELLDTDATGIKDYFGVEAGSGQVYIKTKLDRETTDRVVLEIMAEDMNADLGQQTATGTLSVTIQDYNDEAPRFLPSDQYNVQVSEADGVNSIVLQVSATDDDFGQTIDFSLGTSTVDAFSISSDGTIRLKSKLNRESQEQVVLEVVARDSGSPALVSTATVTVTVLDDNDHKPVFQPHETSFSVSEAAAVGYLVTKFSATDRDAGDFAQIVYTLAGTDNDDGSFIINPTTGELTVGQTLDRETKASYRFEVVASDSPNNPDERKSERSDSITITIQDVDDNGPVFTQVIPEKPFTVESSPVNQTIAQVQAVDDDDPSTDNGRVYYSLTSDTNATLADGTPLFKIDSRSGTISTARSLKDYAGQYYITVMATNQARKFDATRVIDIEVRDVNDDVPRFVKPNPDNAIAYVLENSDIGTSVFELEAVDNDKGPNGEIRYSIERLPNSDRDGSGKFTVDPITGLIRTKSDDLNAESQEKYELKILATDQGYPKPYQTSLTMLVFVLDKNDHEPEFIGFPAPYPLSMPENKRDACVGVDLAKDKDLNTNFTSICYYLIGSSLMNTFVLDVTSGQLCLNKSLDRETTPYVNVVVQALEDCYREDIGTEMILPLENGELYPTMFRPTYLDRLWVEIKVSDVNDNAPRFRSKDLALGVTRVTQFGKFILDLKGYVTDEDSGKNGVGKFVATSPFTASPQALVDELEQLQVSEPFKLFPNGSVKTNMYFKPQMSGYFTVNLMVVDTGGLNDTAKLRISLINDDQRIIIVFRRAIDSVGPIKDEVASRLSAKVGYRIVVDNIQTHQTKEGQADPAKTDMYIHGEDFSTNEVIAATRLLRLIDQKNALLVEILNDYNVVEMTPVNVDDLDDGLEDKLQMALILVAVVLGSICIILASVLFYVHKRYERKLKAATAMAYVNSGVEPNNTNMYISDIPGANIHSYENANPIFMEKILLGGRGDSVSTPQDRSSIDQVGGDNDVDMDDEEQEVILDLTHIDKTRQGEGHGPASHARFAMDQHQRYLEAVIGEHKVKVERGGEEKAREALVVDLVSGDEDDLDIDSQGKARGNNIDAHVNNDDDDDNDDEYDDGVDTGRNGGKYMDEDIDDDFILYGNSRRDSGIEEKSEHSAILSGKGSNSLFNPMIFDGTGNGSYKTGADGGVNKYGRIGLHPTLSYSSSSDTDKPPRKRTGDHPRKSTSTPAVNGRLLDKLDCKATTEPADKSVAIRNVIENSGGIRVFPPGPDTKSSLMNGSAQRENSADAQLLAERGSGVGRDSTAPEPLPRGSPPVRHLRSLKAPQAYSDFKNGLHARESDLESFVELTDL